jgi:hypothetical protein
VWVIRHRWICVWLAALLLAGQFAAAAYACPALNPQPPAVQAPDCAGHGTASAMASEPLRCKAHCDNGRQSINSGPTGANVASPALIDPRWVRVLDVAGAEQVAAAMPGVQPVGPPPVGGRPLYLSLLVLRN